RWTATPTSAGPTSGPPWSASPDWRPPGTRPTKGTQWRTPARGPDRLPPAPCTTVVQGACPPTARYRTARPFSPAFPHTPARWGPGRALHAPCTPPGNLLAPAGPCWQKEGAGLTARPSL